MTTFWSIFIRHDILTSILEYVDVADLSCVDGAIVEFPKSQEHLWECVRVLHTGYHNRNLAEEMKLANINTALLSRWKMVLPRLTEVVLHLPNYLTTVNYPVNPTEAFRLLQLWSNELTNLTAMRSNLEKLVIDLNASDEFFHEVYKCLLRRLNLRPEEQQQHLKFEFMRDKLLQSVPNLIEQCFVKTPSYFMHLRHISLGYPSASQRQEGSAFSILRHLHVYCPVLETMNVLDCLRAADFFFFVDPSTCWRRLKKLDIGGLLEKFCRIFLAFAGVQRQEVIEEEGMVLAIHYFIASMLSSYLNPPTATSNSADAEDVNIDVDPFTSHKNYVCHRVLMQLTKRIFPALEELVFTCPGTMDLFTIFQHLVTLWVKKITLSEEILASVHADVRSEQVKSVLVTAVSLFHKQIEAFHAPSNVFLGTQVLRCHLVQEGEKNAEEQLSALQRWKTLVPYDVLTPLQLQSYCLFPNIQSLTIVQDIPSISLMYFFHYYSFPTTSMSANPSKSMSLRVYADEYPQIIAFLHHARVSDDYGWQLTDIQILPKCFVEAYKLNTAYSHQIEGQLGAYRAYEVKRKGVVCHVVKVETIPRAEEVEQNETSSASELKTVTKSQRKKLKKPAKKGKELTTKPDKQCQPVSLAKSPPNLIPSHQGEQSGDNEEDDRLIVSEEFAAFIAQRPQINDYEFHADVFIKGTRGTPGALMDFMKKFRDFSPFLPHPLQHDTVFLGSAEEGYANYNNPSAHAYLHWITINDTPEEDVLPPQHISTHLGISLNVVKALLHHTNSEHETDNKKNKHNKKKRKRCEVVSWWHHFPRLQQLSIYLYNSSDPLYLQHCITVLVDFFSAESTQQMKLEVVEVKVMNQSMWEKIVSCREELCKAWKCMDMMDNKDSRSMTTRISGVLRCTYGNQSISL